MTDVAHNGDSELIEALFVLTNREHPVMIEPWGKGLLATTLHYPYEVRDDKPYFEDIPDMKLPAEMRQLAAHIVESKAGHFDPERRAPPR